MWEIIIKYLVILIRHIIKQLILKFLLKIFTLNLRQNYLKTLLLPPYIFKSIASNTQLIHYVNSLNHYVKNRTKFALKM